MSKVASIFFSDCRNHHDCCLFFAFTLNTRATARNAVCTNGLPVVHLQVPRSHHLVDVLYFPHIIQYVFQHPMHFFSNILFTQKINIASFPGKFYRVFFLSPDIIASIVRPWTKWWRFHLFVRWGGFHLPLTFASGFSRDKPWGLLWPPCPVAGQLCPCMRSS